MVCKVLTTGLSGKSLFIFFVFYKFYIIYILITIFKNEKNHVMGKKNSSKQMTSHPFWYSCVCVLAVFCLQTVLTLLPWGKGTESFGLCQAEVKVNRMSDNESSPLIMSSPLSKGSWLLKRQTEIISHIITCLPDKQSFYLSLPIF